MVLRRPPAAPPPKKRIWRISQAAPLGEFVDANAPPAQVDRQDLPEVTSGGGWAMSSFELLHGADISEGPDTVPDDLFDELFPPPGSESESISSVPASRAKRCPI